MGGEGCRSGMSQKERRRLPGQGRGASAEKATRLLSPPHPTPSSRNKLRPSLPGLILFLLCFLQISIKDRRGGGKHSAATLAARAPLEMVVGGTPSQGCLAGGERSVQASGPRPVPGGSGREAEAKGVVGSKVQEVGLGVWVRDLGISGRDEKKRESETQCVCGTWLRKGILFFFFNLVACVSTSEIPILGNPESPWLRWVSSLHSVGRFSGRDWGPSLPLGSIMQTYMDSPFHSDSLSDNSVVLLHYWYLTWRL